MNLPTYLRFGYPGLAVISSEKARAEAEIASTCASLKRHLHAWSSTEGLVESKKAASQSAPIHSKLSSYSTACYEMKLSSSTPSTRHSPKGGSRPPKTSSVQ